MNIRDHINAGHYPKDEKGRALVPVGGQGRKGWTATIIATDAPEGIIGFGPAYTRKWNDRGEDKAGHGDGDLLPPAPRKVEVKRWIELETDSDFASSTWTEKQGGGTVKPREGCVIVELTGSYEMPWPEAAKS
jgi:hypothetical protein